MAFSEYDFLNQSNLPTSDNIQSFCLIKPSSFALDPISSCSDYPIFLHNPQLLHLIPDFGIDPLFAPDPVFQKQKTLHRIDEGFLKNLKQVQIKERQRHTLPQNCSTICAGGLNYSVRDGKR